MVKIRHGCGSLSFKWVVRSGAHVLRWENLGFLFENVATKFYKRMEETKGSLTLLPNRKTLIFRYMSLLQKYRETAAANRASYGISEDVNESDTILDGMILEIDEAGN